MGMQKTGDTISITITESMFLNENGLNVSLDYEDLLDWCFQREVGELQMNIFMKILKEHCHKEGISGMYGFCDSNVLSPLTPMTNKQVRSNYLARVFGCNEGKNYNQLFFAPFNDNMHWMLAFISPWNGLVYWLDPLGAENKINSFAEKIITEGIKRFSSVHRKDIKKIKKNANKIRKITTMSSSTSIQQVLWILCLSIYARYCAEKSAMGFQAGLSSNLYIFFGRH